MENDQSRPISSSERFSTLPEASSRDYEGPQVYNAAPLEKVNTPLGANNAGNERRICGIGRKKFWILAAILALIIIGAAVGGGVGGSKASRQSSNSTPTVTVTASSLPPSTSSSSISLLPPAPTTGLVALNCPKIDNTQYKKVETSSVYTFQITCGADILGSQNNWIDIIPIVAYSLNACLDACAGYNVYKNNRTCIGVAFAANLTEALNENLGNCWLKNGTGTEYYADSVTRAVGYLQS